VADVVVDVKVPHPVAGLKLNFTPAFLESLETVAVIVTADEPASMVVELELLLRPTLIAGLLPPQPQIMERRRQARTTRETLCNWRIDAPVTPRKESQSQGAVHTSASAGGRRLPIRRDKTSCSSKGPKKQN
jgi:hypothetical protein